MHTCRLILVSIFQKVDQKLCKKRYLEKRPHIFKTHLLENPAYRPKMVLIAFYTNQIEISL